jgi:energy-coupling factor transporter ATP-binding protein EcfA2
MVGLVFQNPATQIFNATVGEEVAFAPRNLGLPREETAERVSHSLEATAISHLRNRDVRTLSIGEQQLVAIAAVLALRPRLLVLDEPTANLDWRATETVLRTLVRLREECGVTIVVIEHRLHAMTEIADRAIVLRDGRLEADGLPADVLGDSQIWSATGLRFSSLDRTENISWEKTCRGVPGDGKASSLVTISSVSAGYSGKDVLHDIDLAIHAGEFLALVGDNGAGKTTLARVIAGLLRPRLGSVAWNDAARHLPMGRRVGLLFQNPLQQLICDRVDEEVSLGPSNFGLRDRVRTHEILAAADLLELVCRRPQMLSAGQQQRTALAATMAPDPMLLILDEPTMGQDWEHLRRLMDHLALLNQEGQAILLITHDDRLICRYASRIVRLERGRLVEDVPASEWTRGPDVRDDIGSSQSIGR